MELPHTFHDGPGNVASGVQVMENLNVLREAIEALQSSSPGHYFVTTGGFEGSAVKGSKQTVTTPANTLVSFRAMLTETWSPSTEGGYVIKLLRDGVVVATETISVSAGKAVAGYWVGQGRIDYLQEVAGSHAWEVQMTTFGTEPTLTVHRGVLSLKG